MDLRSVLNTADNGAAGAAKPPLTPQQHPQPRPSHSPAQYGYRGGDYPPHQSQPHPAMPHQSPVAQPQDYPPHHHSAHPQQQHPPNYPPASPYQAPGPYSGRPAPPPLQTAAHSGPGFHDARSPGSMAAPSPYRQPPTPSSVAGGAAGYPFPPQHPDMTSPVQRHQYPPPQYSARQRRDSHSQSVAAHTPGATPSSAASGPGSYVQQHPAVPQTPPVTTPGGHPYSQQRSQSVQSTPTPTSAHSQLAFPSHHPPPAHGSPVVAAHPQPDYNRQPSQPAPPPAPGPSGTRQSTGNFAQPPSPYQQRTPSLAHSQIPQPHSSPRTAAPPRPPQRLSTGSHSAYGSPARDSIQRPRSSHEREHSMSVSPKTRVSSIPSNPEQQHHHPHHRPPTTSEIDPRPLQPPPNPHADPERIMTPAKRKLDDRDLSPRELERKEPRPPPGEVNGAHAQPPHRQPLAPVAERKKRAVYSEPPVWARTIHSLGKNPPSQPNFVLHKKPDPDAKDTKDAKDAKDAKDGRKNGAPSEPGPEDLLGQWEASISGLKPVDGNTKDLADFLFMSVVSNPDIQEILSHRIQFEIEAKLGTLIDKDTNKRVARGGRSEFILDDDGRTAFKSSMTETTHKAFNEYLNQVVLQTDPRQAKSNGGPGRVQVHYKHTREIDRFFELPPELQARIPNCVRTRMPRGRTPKARITYDQKTNEVLGKIIKARVADLDIHMPACPMDCRISINLEMDWDGPVEELEQHGISHQREERFPDRHKDRLSYTHGHYRIDLTQVTQTTIRLGTRRSEKEHELEIELNPNMLLEQGRRAMNGLHNRYQELVEGFLDNVRVMARKAREYNN
ncbi:CYTH-like domain-containing protein [Stachybotrys elegans]|uniref:mRNA-capping enzyme subunit beta n=1 Tax=Stachybotrys elegans TaxID=80388 RepID=A0A8K0WTP5_9HYPO|nr:CYTH-like domain-containing protein [Stachybotrys elegans]